MFIPCPFSPVPLFGAWRSTAEQIKRMDTAPAAMAKAQDTANALSALSRGALPQKACLRA